MSETNGKRQLGSPLPLLPMEPSTRKEMNLRFVQPGEKTPYKVTGGIMMEDNNEFGVILLGEGPFFVSETLMREWLKSFDIKKDEQLPDAVGSL